jgi:type II secretion system protein C
MMRQLPPEPWNDLLRRGLAVATRDAADRLRAVTCIALAVVIVAHLVQLTVALYSRPPGTPASITMMRATGSQSIPEQRLELQRVLSAHLFGDPPQAVSASTASPSAHWVLSGVIAGKTPESGVAIIGETRDSMHLCAVGEAVAPGFSLVQVFSDRVMLEGSSGRLSLRLPQYRSNAGYSLPASNASSSTELSDAAPAGRANEQAQQVIGQPVAAQAVLRPRPHHAKGHYDGLEIVGWGDGSALAPLGLQRNDVITQINGRSITSAGAAQQALQQLSSGLPVNVTVERDGAPIQLPVTISDDGG